MCLNKPQQEGLGRTSILLAFDRHGPHRKRKNEGGIHRPQVHLISLLRIIKADYTDRSIEKLFFKILINLLLFF
jgi:hypothetical protein